jgi:hypothetical protein
MPCLRNEQTWCERKADWSARNRANYLNVLVCLDLYASWMPTLPPPLIDMADQQPPQIAKSKGFLSGLKKVFKPRSQSTPTSRSNSPLTVPLPPAVVVPPADLEPSVSITTDPEEAAKLRATYTHFRILVIGRANAGKTTLLKRVCNTREDPVYSKVRYQLRLIQHSYRPSSTD